MFDIPENDLDNIQAPTTQSTQPAKTNGKFGSTPPPKLTWGDQSVQSGDGLNRIKATADQQKRFALVPGLDPVGQLTHFINAGQRKGLYVCPGNGCVVCPREDARWNGVALAIEYTNADVNGKLAADKKPEYRIGYISLSAAHFKTLSEASEGLTPFDIDWVMSFDGKRFGFRPVSNSPRYRHVGDGDLVVGLAAQFAPKLAGKAGRKISAADLKAMLANAPIMIDEEMD
jgi:hypothetical protein